MARRNKGEERAVALERIDRLVVLAEAASRAGNAARADRYAELAWRIKTTYQARRTAIDGRVCRSCHAFATGATRRVRLQGGHRSVTCLRCGVVRRMPLP